MNNDFNYCRVCGLLQEEPPWGNDGKVPSFEYCNCCGVEFGYTDFNLISVKNYRKEWLENGGKWFEESEKPENWDLEEQLKNIPSIYK